MQERRVSVGTHSLNVAVGPENGPPLVLLHGVTRCWRDWFPVLAPLQAAFHVWAMDHRGHGKSDRANGYRVEDYVSDAVRLIEEQFPNGCFVIGHSLGAMVAAAVAALRPGLVRGVVLEDPPYETMGTRIDLTPYADFFLQMQSLAENYTEESVPQLSERIGAIRIGAPSQPKTALKEIRDAASIRFSAACLKSLDAAVLEGITDRRWIEGHDYRSLFPRIQCPTLVLQGDDAAGGTLTKDDVEAMKVAIVDLCIHTFAGCGHQLHGAHTAAFLSVVLPFLAGQHA
ncbi:MAG: alpha/beta hydrolase [Planctomycetaceae bacterium]|nr:alpha/beta hydrolase [Planctomycetaceae bacterium]